MMVDTLSSRPSPALLLFAFIVTLFTLAWLSGRLSLYIQMVIYWVTHSQNLTTIIFFFLLLPGVILHEAAHWLAARALGLKTSKFRVWPKTQGKQIALGSVTVHNGALWQDCFVGMAPLLVGSIALALIGQEIFAAGQVADALAAGHWGTGLSSFWLALQEPDGAFWAYLVFAIGNVMMPSPSDRRPMLPVFAYTAAALLLYVILGLPLAPFAALLDWLTPTLQTLTDAFIFTILLDGLLLLCIYPLERLLAPQVLPAAQSRPKRATHQK